MRAAALQLEDGRLINGGLIDLAGVLGDELPNHLQVPELLDGDVLEHVANSSVLDVETIAPSIGTPRLIRRWHRQTAPEGTDRNRVGCSDTNRLDKLFVMKNMKPHGLGGKIRGRCLLPSNRPRPSRRSPTAKKLPAPNEQLLALSPGEPWWLKCRPRTRCVIHEGSSCFKKRPPSIRSRPGRAPCDSKPVLIMTLSRFIISSQGSHRWIECRDLVAGHTGIDLLDADALRWLWLRRTLTFQGRPSLSFGASVDVRVWIVLLPVFWRATF